MCKNVSKTQLQFVSYLENTDMNPDSLLVRLKNY